MHCYRFTHMSSLSETSRFTLLSALYQIDAFQIKVHKHLVTSMVDTLLKWIRDLDGEQLIICRDFIDHF